MYQGREQRGLGANGCSADGDLKSAYKSLANGSLIRDAATNGVILEQACAVQLGPKNIDQPPAKLML